MSPATAYRYTDAQVLELLAYLEWRDLERRVELPAPCPPDLTAKLWEAAQRRWLRPRTQLTRAQQREGNYWVAVCAAGCRHLFTLTPLGEREVALWRASRPRR